jgi:CRP-like cAMP-binding protein
MSAAREQNFSPRETLFREGDLVRFVFVVAAGRVKIAQLSRTGKQVILRVEGRGAVAGGLGLSPSDAHTVTAQAMEACQVFTWRVLAFEALARRFPALQHNAKNILAQRLRTLEEHFCDVTTKRVPQRLARLLIRLTESSPRGPERIGLSREELAQMTGTTLFTVSRLLRDWAEQDIVQVDRSAIVVEQLPRLLQLADDAA